MFIVDEIEWRSEDSPSTDLQFYKFSFNWSVLRSGVLFRLIPTPTGLDLESLDREDSVGTNHLIRLTSLTKVRSLS